MNVSKTSLGGCTTTMHCIRSTDSPLVYFYFNIYRYSVSICACFTSTHTWPHSPVLFVVNGRSANGGLVLSGIHGFLLLPKVLANCKEIQGLLCTLMNLGKCHLLIYISFAIIGEPDLINIMGNGRLKLNWSFQRIVSYSICVFFYFQNTAATLWFFFILIQLPLPWLQDPSRNYPVCWAMD